MGVGVVSSTVVIESVNEDAVKMLDECDRERPGLVCGEPTNGICSLFERDALIGDDGGRSTLLERYPALTVRISQSFANTTATSSAKRTRMRVMASSAAGLL